MWEIKTNLNWPEEESSVCSVPFKGTNKIQEFEQQRVKFLIMEVHLGWKTGPVLLRLISSQIEILNTFKMD